MERAAASPSVARRPRSMRISTATGTSASARWCSCFAPRSTSRRSGGSASSDLEHHVLDDRVVLDRVHALVLAVTGLLEAAVRHLRDQREVVVDPDGAELDRLGDAHPFRDVARPDRCGEAEAHVVGPCDRLLFVAEVLDADDGAEDLVLDDLAALVGAGDDRRL